MQVINKVFKKTNTIVFCKEKYFLNERKLQLLNGFMQYAVKNTRLAYNLTLLLPLLKKGGVNIFKVLNLDFLSASLR